MAHKDVDIELVVKGVRPETPQHVTLDFERPRGFDYEAGDWLEFEFTPVLRGGPTYSFSSSPTEADLSITFKEGLSEVKQALAGSRPGNGFRRPTARERRPHSVRDRHRRPVLDRDGHLRHWVALDVARRGSSVEDPQRSLAAGAGVGWQRSP